MSEPKKTILLVEDESLIAMNEKKSLEKYGYTVITANSGEKAIERIQSKDVIDLILMDINLGNGIDGTQAAEKILEVHEIPILFVSSHSEREVVEKTEKITSYGYVVKSSSITVLDASIKMAFKLFESNQKLRATKDKLEATFDALPDLLFEIGLDGTYYDIHAPHPEMLYTPLSENRIGKRIHDFLPSNIVDMVMTALHEANATGISVGKQYQLRVQGGIRWFELSVSRMRGDFPEPHFIYLCRDITERERMEDALKLNEVRQNVMISNISDVIGIIGIDGIMKYYSPNMAKWFGWEPQDLVGTDGWLTVHPDDLNRIQKAFVSLFENDNSQQTLEYRYKCKDGSYRPIELSAKNMANDPFIQGVLMNYHDISERKRAETSLQEKNEEYEVINEELRSTTEELQAQNRELQEIRDELLKSKNRYRLLTEYSSDIVFSVDGNGTYQFVNEMFALTAGKKSNDIIGGTFWDIYPKAAADARYEIVKRAFNTGEKESFEISVPLQNNLFYYSSTINPIKNSDGKVILAVVYGKDITERKRAEDFLKLEKKRLQNVLIGTNAGTWEWNIQTGEASLDEKSASLLGYEVSDFKTDTFRKWMDLKHPDDRMESDELLAKHLRGEIEQYTYESRMKHKNGNWIWIHGRGKVIEWDAENRPLRMFGTHIDISERKKAEEELSRNERNLAEAQSVAMVGSWEWNIETNSVLWSKEMYRIYGIDPATYDGKPDSLLKVIHPDDVERFTKSMNSNLKDGSSPVLEYRVIHADGSVHFIRAEGKTDFGKNGSPSRIMGIAQDITQRKASEESLRESEEAYRRLFEDHSAIKLIIDYASGVIVKANHAAEAFYGWSCDSLQMMNIGQINIQYSADIKDAISKIRTDRPESYDTVHRKADGSVVSVEVYPSIIEYRGKKCVHSIVFDTTDKKKAEHALKESESRLSRAEGIAKIGNWKIDLERKMVTASDGACMIYGVSSGTLTLDYIQKCALPEYRPMLDKELSSLLNEGKPYKTEFKIRRPSDGKIVDIKSLAEFDRESKTVYGVILDTTAQVQKEQQINALLTEKENVLKEVHHRIKNNMGTMESLLRLQASNMNDPVTIEALKDAESRLHSMGLLYDKLYRSENLHEMSAGNYLPDLIEEIVYNFPNSSMITTETQIGDFMLGVKELSILGMIINELITNSMKYAFIGKDSGVIIVSAFKKAKKATFTIKDDGVGIPESIDIEHSTGFGLILVSTLTKQLNGEIRIEREEGTKFILEFEA